MTLNHSKTWPLSTLAVVQLKVDTRGRTYSTLTGSYLDAQDGYANSALAESSNDEAAPEDNVDENGVVYPLSKNHLEMFAKMTAIRTTIRTDTVSTILEQDNEFELEHQDEQSKCARQEDVEKFHVLALTRTEGQLGEVPRCHAIGRRPSIKVDNWDFIYTETKPNRCPVHSITPKPELPLDARKTTTLRRHYYLEGGWGWVVVVCAVLVHVLNHGVQLSCSQLVLPGADKFKVEAVHFAGTILLAFCALLFGAFNIVYVSNVSVDLVRIYLAFFCYIFTCFAITLLQFTSRIRHVLKAFELLDRVDESLTGLGVKISYKKVQIISIGAQLFHLLVPLSFVNCLIVGKSIYTYLAELLVMGISFSVIVISFLFWLVVCVSCYERLKLINSFVVKMRNARCNPQFVQARLFVIAGLHQQLCKSVEYVTGSTSTPLLTIYVLCLAYVGMANLSFLDYNTEEFDSDIFGWCFMTSSLTLTITTIIELVTNEVNHTWSVLSDPELVNTDASVNETKNSLLLQMLHHKVTFKLWGMFELNRQTLLGSIGNVTSVVMLMLKFKGNKAAVTN